MLRLPLCYPSNFNIKIQDYFHVKRQYKKNLSFENDLKRIRMLNLTITKDQDQKFTVKYGEISMLMGMKNVWSAAVIFVSFQMMGDTYSFDRQQRYGG